MMMAVNINPQLEAIDSALYRVAVKAIIQKADKFLVVHEIDGESWDMPGGGLDYGEPILDALARELEEEIGVKINPSAIQGDIVFISNGTIVDGIPRVNIFYRVDINEQDITTTKDVDEYRWMTLDELETSNYSESTKEILNFLKPN
jgi:8-oxo-dGTP diphosphatase